MKNIKTFAQTLLKNSKNIVSVNFKNIISALVMCLLIFVGLIYFSNKKSVGFDCQHKYRLEGYKFYFLFPFKKDLKFPVDNAPDKCLYEFYEGLYEASTIFGNHYSNLNKICSYVNSYFSVKSWDQCYFRLGIAMTYTKRTNISRPDDLQKFIDDKIKFCEGLGNNKQDCLIGVYTGVNLAFQNDDKDSRFPIKGQDPFWLCKVGKGKENKLQCYRNLVSFLSVFEDHDVNRVVKLINYNLSDPFEKFELILTYISSLAYTRQISYSDIQKMCITFKDPLVRYACIEGYATGLDEVIQNGLEGTEVTKYCLSPLFTPNERGECLRRGFFELPTTNDMVVKKKACLETVPPIYKIFCEVDKDIPIPN